MKKLVFAALMLGGLAQTTGCIITSDDDDDDVINTAQFDVTWNLTEGASEAAAACADWGITTIQVVSAPTVGSEYIDLYDCIDGYNATAPLPLGDYTVWVNALDSSDYMVAQSNSQAATLDLGGELVPLTFDFPVDGGYFALTWNLVDMSDNPLTCTEVGSGGVGVLSTIVGTADAYDDLFNCEDGEGVTAKVDIADYTVVVDILDTAEPPGSLGMSEPRTVSIEYGNELNDLGNFEFVFE
jgi:hypothetical protein